MVEEGNLTGIIGKFIQENKEKLKLKTVKIVDFDTIKIIDIDDEEHYILIQ